MVKVWLDAGDAQRLQLQRQVEVDEDALVLAARGWPLVFGPGRPDEVDSDADLRVLARLKAIVATALGNMPEDDLVARQARIRATGWWPIVIYQGLQAMDVHIAGYHLCTIPMSLLLDEDAFTKDITMEFVAADPGDP